MIMAKKIECQRINYNVPVELLNKIDEEAEKLCVNRSACLNMICAQYFRSVQIVSEMPQVLATMNAVVAESQRVNPIEEK